MSWTIVKRETKESTERKGKVYKSRIITFKNGFDGLKIVSCMYYDKEVYCVSRWLFESETSETLFAGSGILIAQYVNLKTAFKILRATSSLIELENKNFRRELGAQIQARLAEK